MKELTLRDRLKNIIESDITAQIMFCAICASLFTYGFCFPLINEYVAGAFMAVFVVYECLRQRYIPLDLASLFLIQGLFICALIDFHTNEQYMYWLHWAWVLPLAYLLGKVIAKKSVIAILSMISGLFIQGLLDFHKGHIVTQAFVMDYAWNQFWDPTERQPRTTYEFEFVLMTSMTVLALYLLKKQMFFSIMMLLCNLVIEFYCLESDGRTNICHLAVAICLATLFYIYDKGAVDKKRTIKIIAALGLAGLMVVIIALIFFQINAFGLKDYYNNSFWNRDGGLIHNVRFEAIEEAFGLLIKNPLGGFVGTKLPAGSSHNLWLEYSRHYGLAPFVCLYIFKIITIIYTIKLALTRDSSLKLTRYVLVPAFTAVNLYYSMEPNGFANRNYWFFGLFISGLVAGTMQSENKLTYIKASGLSTMGEKKIDECV